MLVVLVEETTVLFVIVYTFSFSLQENLSEIMESIVPDNWIFPPTDPHIVELPANYINAREPRLNIKELAIAGSLPPAFLAYILDSLAGLEMHPDAMFNLFATLKMGKIPGTWIF